MQAIKVGGVTLHWRSDGPEDAPALVFSNSLGTDFRVWDPLIPHLPLGWRLVRYDKRGHGLSDLPEGEWGMGDHVADLMGLLDGLGITGAVVCGLSVGGLVAQGLAAERPDLVRAMILCDTAAKIGSPELWDERIRMVEGSGIAAMADAVMERWFTPAFRQGRADFPLYRNMLVRTTAGGYARTCAAIRDTDLRDSTARLRLPCLAVCGDADGATPPDLVRETAALVPGSRFELIRGAGHIPPVEQPEALGALIARFLDELG
jgi:3-oxoadipate enol-lactonase